MPNVCMDCLSHRQIKQYYHSLFPSSETKPRLVLHKTIDIQSTHACCYQPLSFLSIEKYLLSNTNSKTCFNLLYVCRSLFFVRSSPTREFFFSGRVFRIFFFGNLFFDGKFGVELQKVLLSDLQWSFLDTIIPSHSDLTYNQAQTLSLGIIQYEKG